MKGPIQPGHVCGRTQSAEYRLIEPIGSRGGEGQVWKAEYLDPNAVRRPNGLSAGDTVALKILNGEHHDNIEEFEQRWRRIADFYVGRDWHRNLVRIYEPPFRGKLPHHPDDYFEKGADTLYLPMEYLEGNSLRFHVAREGPPDANSAPLPALSVRKSYVVALEGIAEGLAELASVQGTENSGSVLSRRSGLVHRDVKPDNIIFPPGRAPVLVDFGSMREMFTSRMYSGISGTGGYMAPEVTDDSVDWALRATPAVDLYAFACVVYFTLSGKNPPSQQSSWQRHLDTFLDPAISEDTRKILLTVLGEEDPEARLRLDVAHWSRAVTQSLNSGSGSSARIQSLPTTPRASNLNPSVRNPTTPDAPVANPARPKTAAAPSRTQPPIVGQEETDGVVTTERSAVFAAENGDAGAAYQLGMRARSEGPQAKIGSRSAIEWFIVAFQAGSGRAALALGEIAKERSLVAKFEGRTCKDWFLLAFERGVDEAALRIGLVHAPSTRVSEFGGRTAAGWFRVAYDRGIAAGATNLGIQVDVMGPGAEIDGRSAEDWYQIGFEMGDADAAFYLGVQAVGKKIGGRTRREWLVSGSDGGSALARDALTWLDLAP